MNIVEESTDDDAILAGAEWMPCVGEPQHPLWIICQRFQIPLPHVHAFDRLARVCIHHLERQRFCRATGEPRDQQKAREWCCEKAHARMIIRRPAESSMILEKLRNPLPHQISPLLGDMQAAEAELTVQRVDEGGIVGEMGNFSLRAFDED